MASFDFTVNLEDLQFILQQIKISEDAAAYMAAHPGTTLGEALNIIIGQDAHLQPFGLRTVDGRDNNLTPDGADYGAADTILPRLVDPVFLNDTDGDSIVLGPGAPVVQGDYAATGTVVDADPRTISNLVVDQSFGNRSALIAALTIAGSADTSADADSIYAAKAAAEFAAAHEAQNLATEAAYELALIAAPDIQAQAAAALAHLATLRTNLNDGVIDPGEDTAGDDAKLAVDAAVAAQTLVRDALFDANPLVEVSLADKTASQSLLDGLTTLATSIDAIVAAMDVDFVLTVPEFNVIATAEATAQTLSANAAANVVTLTASEVAAANATSGPQLAFTALMSDLGVALNSDGDIIVENRSPDIGLSPAYNGWMTFFGQFFDHGLDLITKGGNETVYIPLQPDDPLYVPGSHTNFMALTRSTQYGADGTVGAGHETINTTTSWIDQNQTYTSHASHQVFLREYALVDGKPQSTGNLLDGHDASGANNHAIANWAEVKEQASEMLGIRLSDFDIHNVPLLATDEYGAFIRGPNGYPMVVMSDGSLREGDPSANGGLGIDLDIGLITAVRTGHAFLNDIAHAAAPGSFDPDHIPHNGDEVPQIADTDSVIGITTVLNPNYTTTPSGPPTFLLETTEFVVANPNFNSGDPISATNPEYLPTSAFYDNEMLEAHFITGDGRGNENIGLTTVHSIFHSEHNRVVEADKQTIISGAQAAYAAAALIVDLPSRQAARDAALQILNDWLLDGHTVPELPASQAEIDALVWNGERLFQAGRFSTEMQYQHLVFEEFARKIQPNIDPFVFTNTADIDPSIVAEFAHTVYRFGHSMLNDTVDRLEKDLTTVNNDAEQIGLIEAFLNPIEYLASDGDGDATTFDIDAANGAIIRGMTRQAGAEIDEFVVGALRNNLVGLPLDLAALNIARGRETGVPTLNAFRADIYAQTGDAQLAPYASWLDFAQNIKNPLSLINFVAAYGTHISITSATTLEAKRDAATLLVLGDVDVDGDGLPETAPGDRLQFLNATGAYAGGSLGGLNAVDFWIGGLAEEKMEFGGMLGSSFNFVFEHQMEILEQGDRFYYLSRTQGTNMLNQLEPNTFADLVMRNTDLGDLDSTHLSGLLFNTADMILEVDLANVAQQSPDPVWDSATQQALDPKVVRDNPNTLADESLTFNYLKFSGGEHVVLGGSEGNDTLIGDKGIDVLWGDGGDDFLNAGMESDQVFGGDGDDIIIDPFGDDFLRGNDGNDVISSGPGFDLLFGGHGNDFLMAGTDTDEIFAGEGDDFLLGGNDVDVLMGNEGSDWIEGGDGLDSVTGENSQLFFNSPIIGHDVLNGQGNDTDYDGESGDDIMVQGPGIQRNNGMLGFDWIIQKGENVGADIDLGIARFFIQPAFTLRDRNDSVEAASGWDFDDQITGTNNPTGAIGDGAGGGGGIIGAPVTDSMLLSQNVSLINGLAELIAKYPGVAFGLSAAEIKALPTDTFVFDPTLGADILLGGANDDVIFGKAGNDLIDGDAWLNVKIAVYATPNDYTGEPLFYVDSLNEIKDQMLAGTINPGQLKIVREIITDGALRGSGAAPDFDLNSPTLLADDALHDEDIVLYADSFLDGTGAANYSITRANGTVTVTDLNTNAVLIDGVPNALLGDEGTDTLRHVEILRFTNRDANGFVLPPEERYTDIYVGPVPATGQPDIIDANGGTPTETQSLTADISNVVDLDGIVLSTVRYQWQSAAQGTSAALAANNPAWTNVGPNSASSTFTPGQAQVNQILRVVVTFTDEFGDLETVISNATDGVGDAYTGTANDDNPASTNAAGGSGPTAFDDILIGLAGNDTLNGVGGRDTITGGIGNDNISGGANADTILYTVGDGADTVNGNGGNDSLNITGAAGNAADTLAVTVSGGVIATVGGGTINNVETITANLGGGSDTLNYAGTTAANAVVVDLSIPSASGFASIDNIENVIGGDGADALTGNSGNNILIGANGNDTLEGGLGNDTLNGQAGTDTVTYANASAGVAVNLAIGVQQNTVGAGLDVVNGIEAVIGSGFDDTLTGAGGNEAFFGGDGDDIFVYNMAGGTDTMDGGNGTDTVRSTVPRPMPTTR